MALIIFRAERFGAALIDLVVPQSREVGASPTKVNRRLFQASPHLRPVARLVETVRARRAPTRAASVAAAYNIPKIKCT